MRKASLIAVVIIIAGLLLTSCSQKDESYKVTPDGGLIQSVEHGISLAVEQNAVTDSVKVKIIPMEQPDALGSNQVTDVFTLEGFDAVNGKVTCTIEVQNPLTGDTYAVVSMPTYIKSLGITTNGAMYLPCQVKGNKVSFDIPFKSMAMENDEVSWFERLSGTVYADNNKNQVNVCVLTAQSTSSSADGKFKVIADRSVNHMDRVVIEGYIEYVYNFYKDTLGFDKIEQYSGWPMTVTIRGMYPIFEGGIISDAPEGYFYDVGFSKWIVINKDALGQMEDVKHTIIHEFFHFVQSQYTNKEWFDEATAVWSEERANPQMSYVPKLFKKHGADTLDVMDGPLNLKEKSARHHGYTSAGYIKYLTDHYGADKLVEVYKNIPTGNEVEVLNAIAPVNTWINDFYVQYLSRNVYQGTPPNTMDYKQDSQTISLDLLKQSKIDAQPIMTNLQIPPYGARAVYFELKAAEPDKLNTNISLVGRSETKGIVLNWLNTDGRNFTQLGTGKEKLPLGGLREIAGHRHFLAFLVTNLTAQSIDASLAFEVENIPPLDELVGEWKDMTTTFEDIWLHPEIQKIIDNPPEKEEPVSDELADEFGEGCEMITAEMIYEMFKELENMEGQTFPAMMNITQISETTGSMTSAMDTGDGMSDMGDPAAFEYIDGIMQGEVRQSDENSESVNQFEIHFSYDEENNIVAEGFSDLTWGAEGKTAIKFHLLMNAKRPVPEETP